MRAAIIGAGIAGLACASKLRQQGMATVLFDKGSRPGGRLSSLQLEGMAWDFGAQYITPGSGPFAEQVRSWQAMGLVLPWPDGPQGALVGVPAMASIVEVQCAMFDVRFRSQVQRIDRTPDGWVVSGPGLEERNFDMVVVALPAEQAIPIVSLHDFEMAREIVGIRSQPCWTVMAGFAEPLAGLPAFLRDHGPIAFASRNNSKPGRPDGECWVVQASAQWTQPRLDLGREDAAVRLLAAFARQTGAELPDPVFLKAHRWRFAHAAHGTGRPLWNSRLGLGACGDWCFARQMESAWLAGTSVADRAVDEIVRIEAARI